MSATPAAKDELIEWIIAGVTCGRAVTDHLRQDMLDNHPRSTEFMDKFLAGTTAIENEVLADMSRHLREFLAGAIADGEAIDLLSVTKDPRLARLNQLGAAIGGKMAPYSSYLNGKVSDLVRQLVKEMGLPEL